MHLFSVLTTKGTRMKRIGPNTWKRELGSLEALRRTSRTDAETWKHYPWEGIQSEEEDERKRDVNLRRTHENELLFRLCRVESRSSIAGEEASEEHGWRHPFQKWISAPCPNRLLRVMVAESGSSGDSLKFGDRQQGSRDDDINGQF